MRRFSVLLCTALAATSATARKPSLGNDKSAVITKSAGAAKSVPSSVVQGAAAAPSAGACSVVTEARNTFYGWADNKKAGAEISCETDCRAGLKDAVPPSIPVT